MAWLLTMGYLLKTYYFERSAPPAFTTESLLGSVKVVPRWQDVEEYMLIVSIEDKGEKSTPVGATATTIRKSDEITTNATYRAHFNLEGKLAPLLPKATVKVVADINTDLNLSAFHGETRLGPLNLSSTGLVSGNTLNVAVVNGDKINRTKVALKNSISLAEALRPLLSRQMEIREGSRMSAPIIDPLTGINRGTLTVEIQDKETIVINGKELQAFRVESSVGDIKTLMWIDDDGQTIRRQLLGNLFMERTTMEEAVRQAPSLVEQAEMQPLDVAAFADVPYQGSEDAAETRGGGLATIQNLLR